MVLLIDKRWFSLKSLQHIIKIVTLLTGCSMVTSSHARGEQERQKKVEEETGRGEQRKRGGEGAGVRAMREGEW